MRISAADDAVIGAIEQGLLTPSLVDRVVRRVLTRAGPVGREADGARIRRLPLQSGRDFINGRVLLTRRQCRIALERVPCRGTAVWTYAGAGPQRDVHQHELPPPRQSHAPVLHTRRPVILRYIHAEAQRHHHKCSEIQLEERRPADYEPVEDEYAERQSDHPVTNKAT